MTVTQRDLSNGNVMIFRWNDELTECDYTVGGIDHDLVEDALDRMMLMGGHEGNDVSGWECKIEM